MRKTIVSVLAGLALLMGGALAASATDEVTPMVVGSKVFYAQCQTSPVYTCGTNLKILKTNGTWTTLSLGNTIDNVKQVCPGNSNLRIQVTGPNGGVKLHPYGACFAPGGVATYDVAHKG